MRNRFRKCQMRVGVDLTAHWCVVPHGFGNPTSARYNEADVELA